MFVVLMQTLPSVESFGIVHHFAPSCVIVDANSVVLGLARG
jgi:hypothetical protein